MNHRRFFSNFDVQRKFLPKEFHFFNWNNSALKGNLNISEDSVLVYGNIGIWKTDSSFQTYTSCNAGFPIGTDNRKVFDLHRAKDGRLYAASQFGLFTYVLERLRWEKIPLQVDLERIVAIESVDDTIFVLNRSYLFKGVSNGVNTHFEKIEIKQPEGYENRVSLFKTIWQIHSGEVLGISGKLFVDALGLITIFLSISGIIYFLFPAMIRRKKRKGKKYIHIVNLNKWSLKWHNLSGAWLFIFLIILFFTGMFLRPPLLIAIARVKVKPLKYSHLDQPNPWYDKLRDLKFDSLQNQFILATSDGLYYMHKEQMQPRRFEIQPPVSVMGVNVLEPYKNGAYLVGSFSGLFLWHPNHPDIYDYVEGKIYRESSTGRPVGKFKATGVLTKMDGRQYLIDYDKGCLPLYHEDALPDMPLNVIADSKMSLWNLSLEIHTGRFFRFLLKDFYILIVPLTGLVSIMVLLSGYLLWRMGSKRKNKAKSVA